MIHWDILKQTIKDAVWLFLLIGFPVWILLIGFLFYDVITGIMLFALILSMMAVWIAFVYEDDANLRDRKDRLSLMTKEGKERNANA